MKATTVPVLVVLAGLLAGCSWVQRDPMPAPASPSAAVPSKSRPEPTAQVFPPSPAPVDPDEAAVLRAYATYQQLYDQARADPSKPLVSTWSTVATPAQMKLVRRAVQSMKSKRQVLIGRPVHRPKPTLVTKTSASLSDCKDNSTAKIKKRSGKTVAAKPTKVAYLVSLTKDTKGDGRWRVSRIQPAGSCTSWR